MITDTHRQPGIQEIEDEASRQIRMRGSHRDAVTLAIVRQVLGQLWPNHDALTIRDAVKRVALREEL